MPPAILSRISQSLRQQQKKIACQSDSKRQLEDGAETCPICWKNLPKKPQCLPCGHLFCKGCIMDLKEHAKSISSSAKCPICRGPLEQESFSKLYKRACHHEQIGSTLISLGSATAYSPISGLSQDFTFLSNEVIREYGLAARKLEDCLRLLDSTSATATTSSSSDDETKQKQYRLATLLKLQEVLKYHILPETQYEKRISLLQEAILLSPKPIPEAHMELGKVFVLLDDPDEEEEDDNSYYELAMDQFEIILKLAEQRRLSLKKNGGVSSGTIKKARKLRGKAHFQMALAHQALGEYPTAAKHYDLAHKYKSCFFYHRACKCFFIAGNSQKAIQYGKLALQEEQEDPQCETHLLLLSIYEKFFLVEQLEGHLSESKHYRYHGDIEQYCTCLIQAKNLCSTQSQERAAEVFLRMDTFSCLIPWKLATIQEHFPKKAFNSSYDISHHAASNQNRPRRSNGFLTEESYTPSENTYEMGEMEDSLYSNSLYSNSFDYANDEDDDDHDDHSESDGDEEEEDDDHSDLLTDDDEETGDHWTTDGEDVLSLEEEDSSCHDVIDVKQESSSLMNLEMQDVDSESDEIVETRDDLEEEENDSCHDIDAIGEESSTAEENMNTQDHLTGDSEPETDEIVESKATTLEEVDVVTLDSMEEKEDESSHEHDYNDANDSSDTGNLKMQHLDDSEPEMDEIVESQDVAKDQKVEMECQNMNETLSLAESNHEAASEDEDSIDENEHALEEATDDDQVQLLEVEEDHATKLDELIETEASIKMEEELANDMEGSI